MTTGPAAALGLHGLHVAGLDSRVKRRLVGRSGIAWLVSASPTG
jgi:hypothetical protein